jgi:hypothetical protein
MVMWAMKYVQISPVFSFFLEYGFKELLTSCTHSEINPLVFSPCKKMSFAGHGWLTPIILATQETEIRRMAV